MKYVPIFLCMAVSCCLTESVVVPESVRLNKEKYEVVNIKNEGMMYSFVDDSAMKLNRIFYKEISCDQEKRKRDQSIIRKTEK